MTTGEPAVIDPFDILGAVGNRTGSLVDLVTEQIEALIHAGRLRTGDQLPPERELCRQFGVSRTVVREAVARLSAKNLLEVRGGATGGIVVRAPTAEQVSDSLRFLINSSEATINPDKVLEVRRLLEVEMAGLAAARRTELDLVRLEAIMVESETVGADRERFAASDVAFHTALAAATQNELFVVLLEAMSGVLLSLRRLGYNTPGNPGRALRHHTAILAQVKAGKVAGAQDAMRAHLVEAEETIRLALALETQIT